jgi:hypothetical protein
MLVAGCALAIGIAMRTTDPAAYIAADPALARLLRGMAVIKGAAVLGAVFAVFWRFGWRVSLPVSLSYIAGSWLLAGTTMLIWQLTLIPPAAVVFHAALIAMLVTAWRDDNKRRHVPYPTPSRSSDVVPPAAAVLRRRPHEPA